MDGTDVPTSRPSPLKPPMGPFTPVPMPFPIIYWLESDAQANLESHRLKLDLPPSPWVHE